MCVWVCFVRLLEAFGLGFGSVIVVCVAWCVRGLGLGRVWGYGVGDSLMCSL